MKNYVGADASSPAGHKIFACPADTFTRVSSSQIPRTAFTYAIASIASPRSTTPATRSMAATTSPDQSSHGPSNGPALPDSSSAASEIHPHNSRRRSCCPRAMVLARSSAPRFSPQSPDLQRRENHGQLRRWSRQLHQVFWDTLFEAKGPSFAMNYNPPPTYDYQWSGD